MKKLFLMFVFSLAILCSLDAQAVLIIDITTGSDDLRGGNDNVNLIVIMKTGTQVRFDNLNMGIYWGASSFKQVIKTISLASVTDIDKIRLETTFSGGIGGDNWNLNGLKITAIVSKIPTVLVDASGNPVFRFTGSLKTKDFACSTGSASTTATATTVTSKPAVMTNFNPAVHGFKFTNSFKNIFISGVDWFTGGLCGGMSYASLDYYRTGKTIPQQPYMPAEGMPLQSYLYNRQVTSLTSNLDRWAELMINPGGARNREFFNWGIQAGSGQLGVLMSNIDRGLPVVIGLSSCGNGCKADHQVVAIGYQLGRYRGDMGGYIEDLIIFIYDPNKPTEIRKLKPSFTEGIFYCADDNSYKWRTFFVDTKFTPSTPPVIPDNPKELILTFVTGGDDLRGGNDNVNISVYINEFTRTSSSSYRIYRENLNNGKRWINNSTQSVSIPLADNYNRNYIVKVELCTRNFAGGIGGDNWNLDRFIMQDRINGTVTTIIDKSGSPLFRFTGDNKTLIINK